ncbi:PfkB family carbohydrate kinase [Glutamicibacter sp.]|uniref:1-phosphofructokinase family hexose kinase n=1 Tax=Glutamicibacter sp. TaxID=1931995 RepID=UPI0028BD2854|nr:PfkB family carbohydrate kinase [Glutamicibacter sp.]
MILAFTPNPAMDETYAAPGASIDSSHRVSLLHRQAGGKGLNVARVLHAQQYPTHAIFPSGGRTGREFVEELQSAKVPFTAVPTAADTRRSMSFFDPQANTTSVFNEAGSPLSTQEWEQLHASYVELLEGADAVAICGSWPAATDPALIRSFITEATERGIYTMVDTSGPLMLEAASSGAVLKPNEHELLAATGAATLIDGAAQLLQRGAAEIYLSAAERGIYHFTQETPLVAHARLGRALTGNPTGAGDSAVAAILASKFARSNREDTLRRAVGWSASTVLMPTAGVLSPETQTLNQEVVYRILPEGEDI